MKHVAVLAAAMLLAAAADARTVRYQAPSETVPAELAGSETEVVVNNCSACHSLDYIVTQPRGKGAQFWRDSVNKMVTVYRAPLSPEDSAAVAESLAKKFG